MSAYPTLLQQKQRIDAGKENLVRKIMLYGDPGSGKSEIAGTAAMSSYIDHVFYFDCDNSLETVIYSPRIPDEAKAKIVPFRLRGSNEEPLAVETMLNGFTSRKRKKLCFAHGSIECTKCRGLDDGMMWSLYSLGPRDLVVIDPGSMIAEQLYSYCKMQNEEKDKPNPDKRSVWMDFYEGMNDIQSALLDCPTNIIWSTHELDITKTVEKGTKREREVLVKTVPLCGSRNYSKNVSKNYGYKISCYIQGKSYKATTTIGQNAKTVVSARRTVPLYDEQGNPSLVPLFDPTTKVIDEPTGPTIGTTFKPKLLKGK